MSDELNKSLEQGMLEVIKEKLPEMQVKVITDCFNERNEFKGKVKEFEEVVKGKDKTIEDKKNDLTKCHNIIKSLDDKLEAHENIDKREKEVTTRELRQEINDLKVAHATDQVTLAKELFKIPFQNRVLREHIVTDKSIPVRRANSVYDSNTNQYRMMEEDNIEQHKDTEDKTTEES